MHQKAAESFYGSGSENCRSYFVKKYEKNRRKVLILFSFHVKLLDE